jgi:hypothetical protein
MQGHNERGCKIITRKMSAKQEDVKEYGGRSSF